MECLGYSIKHEFQGVPGYYDVTIDLLNELIMATPLLQIEKFLPPN